MGSKTNNNDLKISNQYHFKGTCKAALFGVHFCCGKAQYTDSKKNILNLTFNS